MSVSLNEYLQLSHVYADQFPTFTSAQKFVFLSEMLSKVKAEEAWIRTQMAEVESAAVTEVPADQSIDFGPNGKLSVVSKPIKEVTLNYTNLAIWIDDYLRTMGGNSEMAKQIVEYCKERRKTETSLGGVQRRLRRTVRRSRN